MVPFPCLNAFLFSNHSPKKMVNYTQPSFAPFGGELCWSLVLDALKFSTLTTSSSNEGIKQSHLEVPGAPLTWCSHHRTPRGPRDVWGLETTRMGGYSDRWWRRASCVQFSGIGWRSCERKDMEEKPFKCSSKCCFCFLLIAILWFANVFCLSNSCVSEGSWMSGKWWGMVQGRSCRHILGVVD